MQIFNTLGAWIEKFLIYFCEQGEQYVNPR